MNNFLSETPEQRAEKILRRDETQDLSAEEKRHR